MWLRGWALVGAALVGTIGEPGASRAEAPAGRRVLGTTRVVGLVEARQDGAEWRALQNGALLDGMQLRTGPEGRAVLELTNGDVAALGGSSSAELGGEGARLRLLTGRLAVRLQPSSALLVDTPAATVALPALRPVAVGGPSEALLTLGNGTTTVRSFRGTFEARRPGAEPIVIADNQTVTVGAEAGAPPAPAAPEAKSEESAWAALGISPGMGAALGGVLAVGGGVGGAAASGAFSGESSETGTAADQGSPFRPIRR
jgi:hypothetical protein